jgi:hypothetical protein
MIYRDGTADDWPKIETFLAETDYFTAIDCATLGGHWLVAEHDGDILATIWCFTERPHAYLDYFAGRGKTAATLGIIAETMLKRAGVQYVRGMIRSANTSALRLATEGLGMLTVDKYNLVFKEIANGTAKDDRGEQCSTGRAARARHPSTVATTND